MQHVVDAVLRVQQLGFKQREDLTDEIHAHQPNLLYSVIVLRRFGCDMAEIEVMLNLLLVFYEAMKAARKDWPVITEADCERCLQQMSERMQSGDGLTPAKRARLIGDSVTVHPEPQLLAYLVGTLADHGLTDIKDDPWKMLVLAAFTLVECIAQTAPRGATH